MPFPSGSPESHICSTIRKGTYFHAYSIHLSRKKIKHTPLLYFFGPHCLIISRSPGSSSPFTQKASSQLPFFQEAAPWFSRFIQTKNTTSPGLSVAFSRHLSYNEFRIWESPENQTKENHHGIEKNPVRTAGPVPVPDHASGSGLRPGHCCRNTFAE